MYVNEVMTTSVTTCRSDTSLDEIARQMWNSDCGAVPVLDANDKPIGIVTDRDIAMSAMLNHTPLWEIPAATVTRGQQLCCCNQHDPVEDCITTMEQRGVRRLPVTDDAGKLVGILSMSDALALTQPVNGPKRTPPVRVEHVLGMLRKVATRHSIPTQPLQSL
jgi:CBS domain-containing protein